jgi:hypothetical protein
MARRVEVPTAVILSANWDRCLLWSCRKCRSYSLEPFQMSGSGAIGGGGGGGGGTGTGLRCRTCQASNAGVASFFLQLTFDVEGELLHAIASDSTVERLVGCSAAQWAAIHGITGRSRGSGGDTGGDGQQVKLVEQALRGTVCSLLLQLPDPRRAVTSTSASFARDPKVVEFTPRQPFWPFYLPHPPQPQRY